MKVASLKLVSNSSIFSIEWKPGIPLALHEHVKLLIDEIESGHSRSSHVSPSHTGDDFHSCTPIVCFTKNALINSPQRLQIRLAEIDGIVWDLILFAETRASTASVILDGGHKLYTVHGNGAGVASGVGTSIHVKYARAVIAVHRCSDRVMGIDLKFGYQTIRMIFVYMFDSSYDQSHGIEYLESIYDQLY